MTKRFCDFPTTVQLLLKAHLTPTFAAVAILEIKEWGALRGQGRSCGANINVHLAW